MQTKEITIKLLQLMGCQQALAQLVNIKLKKDTTDASALIIKFGNLLIDKFEGKTAKEKPQAANDSNNNDIKEFAKALQESKVEANARVQKEAALIRKICRLESAISKELKETQVFAQKLNEKHKLIDNESLAGDTEFSKFLEDLKLDKEIIGKIKSKYMSRKGSVEADNEYMEYLKDTDVKLTIPTITIEELQPYMEITPLMCIQLRDIIE